ncbi:lipoxygenase domain-containing protein [Trichoderma breve]|uniref:Manganese lipoxygenase n=1 Tax=Trichoderma breve TaxID=2034170 RepID=A0A9W9BMI2_9HYPO|nr:lipoxygenase domain-containing protein [Trichoderma breve]KAJ4862693.1 lipoxygenase domain-containing protein [Trichoderma breve]
MRSTDYVAAAAVLFGSALAAPTTYPACIPQLDPNPEARAAAVSARRDGFIYGPSLTGEAAPFPNGTLGNARSKADYDAWSQDRAIIDELIALDVQSLQGAIQTNGGLNSWQDYERILYDGQLNNTNPRGIAPGIISNATQDLLFSMERLSEHPHAVRRVMADEPLPFPLDDVITSKIVGSGNTLESLQASNRLFIVDHSYQAKYDVATVVQRFPVACSAYFYIDPESGNFLPLAIRTNVDADLTYTPLDSANDWLLAKMMFNANDMFHAQMLHLVVSHDVTESVHQAALHTLSEKHPIMILLERLMVQAYSSRIVGEELCFNPGGHWDQLMVFNQFGCRQFVTDSWPVDGRYQSGYLENNLKARGLIDDNGKSVFNSFPFYDDAKRIRDNYHIFFTSFVNSYYKSEYDLSGDFEVHNWFNEASTMAKAQDFPQEKNLSKKVLIDVLTHFAYATSVSHHSVNGGAPIASGTLPFHIPAIYTAIPKEKGVKDLMPYLPDPATAVHYLGFMASFNRPFYGSDGRTLKDAFDATTVQSLNQDTKSASKVLLDSMQKLSQQIRSRAFDSQGLSQNMPFIYRTLDPAYIPFFCAV